MSQFTHIPTRHVISFRLDVIPTNTWLNKINVFQVTHTFSHVKMVFNLLLVILIVGLKITELLCVEKYCFVSFDSPAIILNSTELKDRTYEESKFDHLVSLLDISEAKLKDWSLIDSLSATDNQKTEGFVLDHRWEHFIDNNIGPSQIVKLLEDMKNSSIAALSFKGPQSILNMNSQKSWHHFFVKRTNQDTYTFNGTSRYFNDTLYIPKSMWRIHYYNYFYSGNSTNEPTVIYHGQNNCWQNNINDRCVYFYLAMCSDCMLNIELMDLTSNNTNNANFTTTKDREWKQVKICHEMSECFQISIKTWRNSTQSSHGFWALGQEVYLSNCTNPTRYLSYKTTDSSVKGCERVDTNERINETDVKDLSCLDDSSRKQLITAPNNPPKDTRTATNSLPITKTTTVMPKKPETSTNDSALVPPNKDLQEPASIFPYFVIPIGITLVLLLIIAIVYYIWRKHNRTFVIPEPEEIKLILEKQVDFKPIQRVFQTAIKRSDFKNYVHQSIASDLREQFETLPKKIIKSNEIGRNEENLLKNRNTKEIPYDENRVVLQKNSSNIDYFQTDYINASYVQGCTGKNDYIFTQDPKDNTISDFWLMVWQENIKYILVLTDGKSDAKWPQNHAGITITLVKIEKYEFYTNIHLILENYNQKRELIQLQYNAWVDKTKSEKDAKPIFSHTLVPYINEILRIPHDNTSPVLVYSRALSTDPSGLVILCDIALRQSPITGQVDMYEITRKIRESRHNLVENVEQYQLAHLVVLECLNCETTGVKVDEDFDMDMNTWNGKEGLNLYENLQQLKWIDGALGVYKRNTLGENKNRYPYKPPIIHSQVLLQYVSLSFINAHYIDSYHSKNRFIVTQRPLEHSVVDFWIMMLQNNVSLVIILDEVETDPENYPKFMPTQQNDIFNPIVDVWVSCVMCNEYEHFDKITINLRKALGKNQFSDKAITVMSLKNWKKGKEVPDNHEVFIQIWKQCREVETRSSKIVVCCDDGVTCCGLYVAFSYLIERMLQEKMCDVVGAVRAVRRSHPDFVTSENQFTFLINCALLFYKTFIMKPSRS